MSESALRDSQVVMYHGESSARRGWLAAGLAGLLTVGTFVMLPFADLLTPEQPKVLELRTLHVSKLEPEPEVVSEPEVVEPVAEPVPERVVEPLVLSEPEVRVEMPPLPEIMLELPPLELALDRRMDFGVQVPVVKPIAVPQPVVSEVVKPAPVATPQPVAEPAETAPPVVTGSGEPVEAAPPVAETGSGVAPVVESEGSVDQVPQLLASRAPIYPGRARRHDVEGFVVVQFVVGLDGRTESLSVVDSVPRDVFVESALAAVRAWRYRPGVKGGRDVPTRMQVRIRFRLE